MSSIASISPTNLTLPSALALSGSVPVKSSAEPSSTRVAKAQTGAKYQAFVPPGYEFRGGVTLNGGTHGNGRFKLYHNAQKDAWAAVSPNGRSVTLFRPGSVSKDEAILSLNGRGPLDVTHSVTNCKTERCPPEPPR